MGKDIFKVRLVRGGHSVAFNDRWAHRGHTVAFRVRWAHGDIQWLSRLGGQWGRSVAFKVRWAHGDVQWLLTSHPHAHSFLLLFVSFG